MKQVAIIGVGPRGLSALEYLFAAFAKESKIEIPFVTLFEVSEHLGAGQVWSISQPKINWLNISQRALNELKGRNEIIVNNLFIPAFPNYADWLPEDKKNNQKSDPDLFPPRSQMGKYLYERYLSIAEPLLENSFIKIVKTTVDTINYKDRKFKVRDIENKEYVFDEVALTIGHQPTELSSQLSEWKEHFEKNKNLGLFLNPYPVQDISNSKKIKVDTVVGVRGFGLAMIDDIRALTIERGGAFKIIDNRTFKSEFKSSKDVPNTIVPFSLDGLPMIPKPLNGNLDEAYTPDNSEIEKFEKEIGTFTEGAKRAKDIFFLKREMAKVVAEQYIGLGKKAVYIFENSNEVQKTVIEWFDDDDFGHPSLYPQNEKVEKTIEDFINMAVDGEKITLDYCAGQVWRYCQPSMYKLFSHAKLPDEVLADIVALDERIKRYAYGPPVESMQQLLALNRAGVLNFNFCNNPDIELTNKGWKLNMGGDEIVVNCMLNSILDSPQLLKVSSSIIKVLLANDLLKPVHSELGIKTRTDGCIELPDKEKFIPLAVLGRLSKGSILGVDAILECFRLRIEDWANGVVSRIKN